MSYTPPPPPGGHRPPPPPPEGYDPTAVQPPGFQPYQQPPQQPLHYQQPPNAQHGYGEPVQQKRPKWPWIVGGLIVLLGGCGALVAVAGDQVDTEPTGDVAAVEDEPVDSGDSAETTVAAPEQTDAVGETSPPATDEAEPESDYTPAQQNAIRTAEDYLAYTAFSRQSLIDQLEFEQYDVGDATIAVDSLDVDWNEQAAKSAADYLDYTGFSCQGLIDQLVFEGFTQEQATYGVGTTGIC